MDAESPPPKNSSANLSDLVKEMVKEMDANEFYSRNDMYDDSAEVMVMMEILFVVILFAGLTAATTGCCHPQPAGHQRGSPRLGTRLLRSACQQ